jgi:hypothetical protein
MANAIYDIARQKFLDGELSWVNDNIKCAMVDATYTPNFATHEFFSVCESAVVRTSQNLTSKTSTAGVADADNLTFLAVEGNEIVALVLFVDTGDSSTSSLIAYMDTGLGIPIAPNGGQIDIRWSDLANRIFKL